MKILIIHGPNMNKLGKRDQDQYGTFSQEALFEMITKKYPDIKFSFFQSNYEGELIDVIHDSNKFDGVIINPAALTHYSYALRDAMETLEVPFCDVHLSDISRREDFRKINVLDGLSLKSFMGKKQNSYFEAVSYIIQKIKSYLV